ncbi:MAG: TonB-dependent receptor [Parvularculaceae bacterium]
MDRTTPAKRAPRLLFAGCSILALTTAAAKAQVSGTDEIVVTAQKREESIRDVPLAITAVTAEFTRDVNLNDVKDLVTFTPGVTGNSQDSFIDTLSVRGILTNDFGIGGEPSVGFFKDGLYQGRNGAVVTSLYDLDRAEILRGPQNFLFGRSAIGGAVSVVTAKPKVGVYEGYAELDVGSRGRAIAEGAVNIPVAENFALRIAAYGAHENGFVNNAALPNADPAIIQEKYAFRLSSLYEANRVSALFTAEYEDRNQSGSLYRATGLSEGFAILNELTGVTIDADGRDIDSDLSLGERDDAEILSFGFRLDVDLGYLTLTSLTGYKDHQYDYAEDFDGSPLNINSYAQEQEGEYFEQEVRVVSDDSGPFDWYAGVSYYDENIDASFVNQGDEELLCAFYYFTYYGVNNFGSCLPTVYYATAVPEGLFEQNLARGRYSGWAAYVDATYAFSDRFDVGVGLRYERNLRRFSLNALPVTSALGPFFASGFSTDGFVDGREVFDAVTPRFVGRYRPNENWLVFASATRGFKSGGFGSFAVSPSVTPGSTGLTNADVGPDPFDPERAWSYEIGTKGSLFDGRAIVDANVYYYVYRDLQLNVPGSGGSIVVDNVGRVEGWGVEGSANLALTDNISLLINGAYADTEVSEAQAVCDGTDLCEGSSQPQVPTFSGSAVLQGAWIWGPGAVEAQAEVFGQTETFGGFLQLPEAVNDGYADLSIRLGYAADAGWTLTGYIENVTDAIYFDGVAESAGIIPAHVFGPSRPRTFGARIAFDFGG